jgi:preprotein translocase subunit SecG
MPKEARWAIAVLSGALLIYLGWLWHPWLATLHYLLCLTLILVVLLQSGKAADLAGAFGGAGSQTAFGPRGAATFLSKATTWCAIMFMATAISLAVRQSKVTPGTGSGSVLEGTAPVSTPAPVPAQPTTPAGQQAPPAGQTAPATTPAQPPAQPPAKTPPPAKQ